MPKSRQRRATIRVSEIRELSKLQVSDKEAAAVLGIRVQTFREILRVDEAARRAWEDGRELGKVSLRRNQMQLSQRYPAMAIFLGKQYLGQNDVSVIEHSGRDGEPIKSMDLTKLTPEQRKHLRDIMKAARKS